MQALKLNLMSVRRVGLAGFGLVASLDLVATWLLIPLLRLVTTFLLAQAAIPFVSVDNVVTLLTTHLLIVCALLGEVCVVLALLGLQVLVAFSGLLIAQVAAELALSATALGLVATPQKTAGPHQWCPWWLLILVVFVFAAMPSDWTYLTTKLTAPLTVAHRGVDGKNGVPNSIAVLKKTH